MKKLLLSLLYLMLSSSSICAQTIVPPIDIRSKSNVLKDVTIGDSVRIVYGKSTSFLIGKGRAIESANADVIAVKKNGKIYYGYAIKCVQRDAVAVKDGGQVLIKSKDNETFEGKVLYGCENEEHTESVITPNLVTGGILTPNVKKSDVIAHIIMEEADFMRLAEKSVKKIRLETDLSFIDIEVYNGNPNSNIKKTLPAVSATIIKESKGFSQGF